MREPIVPNPHFMNDIYLGYEKNSKPDSK